MNNEPTLIESPQTTPLEPQAPQPVEPAAPRQEKENYWSSLLTGNLETVPLVVRRKAGADNLQEPAETRDYRLASNINRSWVVDYKGMSREQVRDKWPELRHSLAQELEVQDDEHEIYTALSLRHADAPVRARVRDLYTKSYTAGLKGEEFALPQDEADRRICEIARGEAARTRQEYLPLAESLAEAWSAMSAEETQVFPCVDMMLGIPGAIEAVDSLAEMQPEERAKVYEITRSLESVRQLDKGPQSTAGAMFRNLRRGVADMRYSILQAAGNTAVVLMKAAGESLGSQYLLDEASVWDKRAQAFHELRQVGTGDVFPIKLDEESSFLEELAVDAAGAIPGVALAFMGGAGFATLTLAGTGAAVAEARRRSPEVRQELQTAAGIMGGALQAAIYICMSRIGGNMLSSNINNFLKARNAGVKGYSIAALKGLGILTAENAKLLLAGKAAQSVELGMQELAAQVDRVASNIDWESWGNNILDIETNMREAAMNLPFVLIASGRAALHYFRSPDIVLDNRRLLAEWGVDDALRQRILETPDPQTRNDLLRTAFCNSRRWGGTAALEDCIRSLRLLNTDYHTDFGNEEVARQFLNYPSELGKVRRPKMIERNMDDPATVDIIVENMGEKKNSLVNRKTSVELMRLWDEWYQKGNGEMMKEEEGRFNRAMTYLNMHKDQRAALPPEYRLDGYYNPNRAKVALVCRNDLLSEIVNLSYQYLINTESLGSLTHSYASATQAQTNTEARRRRVISKLCAAMEQGVNTGDLEAAMDEFCNWFVKSYDNRRRSARNAPLWMHRIERSDFSDSYQKAMRYVTHLDKKKPSELRDFYRIMLGFRACAESLVNMFPHNEDFQELLSSGYSPEQSIPFLLQRELAGHLDSKVWSAPVLNPRTRNQIDNERRFELNRELCNLYILLSGNSLESTPAGEGKSYWRIKRPDGQYTPWFTSMGLAVNSLAGNVKSLFLPMGKDELRENIAKAYRYGSKGSRAFYAGYMYRLHAEKFTGFDHLGRTAAEDLRSTWMSNSTMYTTGLEFAPGVDEWNRFKGKKRVIGLKELDDGNDGFLIKQRKYDTPLSLAQTRFYVYWHRLLSSGWVKPEAVAETLVETGEIRQAECDAILTKGRDATLSLQGKTGPRRRELLKKYPDKIVPGDKSAMNSDLARRMAELNLKYMLADLPDSKLPKSVQEWVYVCSFTKYNPQTVGPRVQGLVRKLNREAAEQVKSYIPRVAELRKMMKSEKGIKLAQLMRNAYYPDEARRYEQGWSFAVGGESAFRSAGQTFWNMLENPARGWKLLTPEDREALRGEISEFCGGRSQETALQELTDVLQQYPGLRAYSSDLHRGGQVMRMELTPIEEGFPTPSRRRYDNTRMMQPPTISKGYTVDENATLPAEWAADSRVLPALQLHTELRRHVTASPYADHQGIWWKKERYGGADGKRPNGLDEHWVSDSGLSPFLNFYERVHALGKQQGTEGQLNVCGVRLGGIEPGDIDTSLLRNITIYRNPEMPEHQVRLMPGEPNAANPYQRKPYVIHTADGIPLLPTRIARRQSELMQAIKPLNDFNSNMNRSYDYTANQYWRKTQLDSHMRNLLWKRTKTEAAWRKADETEINNLELYMQVFQDSRLSYFLEQRDPTKLTRGEAIAAELSRLILLAEFGKAREKHVQELVAFCRNLRETPEDQNLLLTTLHRVVSPDPGNYSAAELNHMEQNRTPDPTPEHAQLD